MYRYITCFLSGVSCWTSKLSKPLHLMPTPIQGCASAQDQRLQIETSGAIAEGGPSILETGRKLGFWSRMKNSANLSLIVEQGKITSTAPKMGGGGGGHWFRDQKVPRFFWGCDLNEALSAQGSAKKRQST